MQINDWSLRTLAPIEMKTGFGWIQAKPACSMAPFAVTPDELGDAWRNGRVCLDLHVDWNGQRFGAANGAPMGFGFHELVAHAARTRASGRRHHHRLRAPCRTRTSARSAPPASPSGAASSCVDQGAARTGYMRFGDTRAHAGGDADGRAPFGVIDQQVVQHG